ncbi:MAG: hypothetical protein JW725_01525 [Candidatus Babeliaceae bacterium]|nr:hypothetical protein [Candidatus Babeliaceae bacterium]
MNSSVEWVRGEDEGELSVGLQTFSIGGSKLIWLGDTSASEVMTKKVADLLSKGYAGPHKIAFFVDSKRRLSGFGREHVLAVNTDDELDRECMNLLGSFFWPSLDMQFFLPSGGFPVKNFTLDDACMLLRYQVLGVWDRVEACWLSRLLPADRSLYTLGQYFFARDVKRFMAAWWDIRFLYPPEFWIVFWLDLLWQAWLTVTTMRAGGTVDRRQSYRLPFSFLQRDWKRYQARDLVVAHNALYGVDYTLKAGGNEHVLEHFLCRFVMNYDLSKVRN